MSIHGHVGVCKYLPGGRLLGNYRSLAHGYTVSYSSK
jgi:hypothetical protein